MLMELTDEFFEDNIDSQLIDAPYSYMVNHYNAINNNDNHQYNIKSL